MRSENTQLGCTDGHTQRRYPHEQRHFSTRPPKANTVAIFTTTLLPTSRVLSIKKIPLGATQEPAEMTPYVALRWNKSRGVIYLPVEYKQEAMDTLTAT